MSKGTKKCPKCGAIVGTSSNIFIKYDTPFQTCPSCGATYYDNDFVELALEKDVNSPDKKLKIALLVLTILIVPFIIGSIYLYTLQYTYWWIAFVASAVCLAVSVKIYSNNKVIFKSRKEEMKQRRKESEERCLRKEYLIALKDNGYPVPHRFLSHGTK